MVSVSVTFVRLNHGGRDDTRPCLHPIYDGWSNGGIYKRMVNLYRLKRSAIFALLLLTFPIFGFASIFTNLTPQPKQTETAYQGTWGTGIFKNAYQGTWDIDTIISTNGMSVCAGIAAEEAGGNEIEEGTVTGEVEYLDQPEPVADSVRITCAWEQCLPGSLGNPEFCATQNRTGTIQFVPETVETCSSGDIQNGDNCYQLQDVLDNDTCPNSTSDDFLLPLDGSGNTNVCAPKPDGSICAYSIDQSGEFYIADFEADCYSNPDQNQEYGATLNQPTGDNCQDIGGVTACPEDPANVCVNGQCLEGCGYMSFGQETQFLCLSSDTDSDGIGDYADPDIDGDGIPNSQDLDSDGDGVDDPDYSGVSGGGANGGGTTNVEVNVDNSVLEDLMRENNSKLDTANNSLDTLNESVANIEESLKSDGVDTSNMEHNDGLTGFYEPQYPNGWNDVWAANEQGFNQSAAVEYINSWKVNVSGSYAYPQFCIDVGIINLGCHDIVLDDRIFPFIRIILIVSSLFLARQITVGG